MKRLAIILVLILPGLAQFPQYDYVVPAPLPHYNVVTFTTFAAVVIAQVAQRSLRKDMV